MVNITIIGSSHIATDSVKKIKKEIKEKNPDIVAVELDVARVNALFNPYKNKISINSLKKVGLMGTLFTFFGKMLQDKLGKVVGISPGEDMKTAIVCARKNKSKIWLIDKNIQTLARELSTKISFLEKIKILGTIIAGMLISPFLFIKKPKKGIDLTKVPPKELIDDLISELRKKFPKLYKILIEERNEYMATNLKNLYEKNPESKILAVVGAGHIPGIKDILKNKYSIDIREI